MSKLSEYDYEAHFIEDLSPTTFFPLTKLILFCLLKFNSNFKVKKLDKKDTILFNETAYLNRT